MTDTETQATITTCRTKLQTLHDRAGGRALNAAEQARWDELTSKLADATEAEKAIAAYRAGLGDAGARAAGQA